APARSAAERTAASGRLLQPAGRTRGAVTRWGAAPFRVLQRAFPGAGTGLVVMARHAG
ncbi:MAG: class SAM-dependent methyltransferase, partial [Actinomycetia bacterium]|nr:class SAM-dependent methyltransferase [Actinomycetes bacterium]